MNVGDADDGFGDVPLGFEHGRVLEPGCGSGNFLAFAPDGAQGTGIELDPVTAGIAGLLYPGTEIRAESFAASRDGEASYDLAIGNVPFGNMVLHDRRHGLLCNPFSQIPSLPGSGVPLPWITPGGEPGETWNAEEEEW